MILDELAAFARKRVAADQAKTPLADIKAQAEAMERDGFLILGEDYGCARPLKLTQAFLDDLDSGR